MIEAHTRRGGKQYQDFAKAIERLSQVTYLNDRFYDPMRAEHRKVSFGFLSYSLPLDPESCRAWRIAWDPIFFEIVQAAGGSFRFDLATYKELDPASRRLFLLLCKIFARRDTSPRFDLTHLAVNVLGFSSTVPIWDLKTKVWRCVCRLAELEVIGSADKERLFVKKEKGRFSITLERGKYFAKRRSVRQVLGGDETMVHEPLRILGFDDGGVRWLMRTFSMQLLREWTDIALRSQGEIRGIVFQDEAHKLGSWTTSRTPQLGGRTPPDWWHEQRRAENRASVRARRSTATPVCELPNLPDESRRAFEKIASDMFSVFMAMGQVETVAKANAEKFAQECAQRGDSTLAEPLQRLFKT